MWAGMILFKPEHIQPILEGRKTETRRSWKKPRAKKGAIHIAKTKMLSSDYFARIRIKYVRKQRLGAITTEEVLREGYSRKEEYLQKFIDINKLKSITPNDLIHSPFEVYVIGFEVVS